MKTIYQTAVIDKLRKIREDNNHSQAFVARTLGISPGQLGNIESYKRGHKYTLKQIYVLSNLFNIPIEVIFSSPGHELKEGETKKIIEQIIRYQDDKEED